MNLLTIFRLETCLLVNPLGQQLYLLNWNSFWSKYRNNLRKFECFTNTNLLISTGFVIINEIKSKQ